MASADEMHALGVSLGMDERQAAITADKIVEHVRWLERRAAVRAIRRFAPLVPVHGVSAVMRAADALERGEGIEQ